VSEANITFTIPPSPAPHPRLPAGFDDLPGFEQCRLVSEWLGALFEPKETA